MEKNFDLTVGLFGSCDTTTFRKDLFIPAYENAGIKYFNRSKKSIQTYA